MNEKRRGANYDCPTYNRTGKKHRASHLPRSLRRRYRVIKGYSKEDPRVIRNKQNVIKFLLKEKDADKKLKVLLFLYQICYQLTVYTTFYEEYAALKELVLRGDYTAMELIKAIKYNIVNGPIEGVEIKESPITTELDELEKMLKEISDG